MGLLDEAIREHLELKRQRGADPTEIAREEREVLEPIFPDEPRPDGSELVQPPAPGGDAPLDHQAVGGTDFPPDHDLAQAEFSSVGQETVELDMQAVLEQDARIAAGREPSGEDPSGDDEALDWEMPERTASEPPPEPLPGQERLSFE
jgi:hypothetical protein